MHVKLEQALQILKDLRLPSAQINERSALCFLALTDIQPDSDWKDAKQRLIGVTPIMEFAKEKYDKLYAPNSRETFRRFTLHQFVEAGIAEYNPDDLSRPTNSPKAVYHISARVLEIVKEFGNKEYNNLLNVFFQNQQGLLDKYAMARDEHRVPIVIDQNISLTLSPGEHSNLIKKIIFDLSALFLAGSRLVYIGDTEAKWGYCDKNLCQKLDIQYETHGKMPDVILYLEDKNWLCLIEAVTSHGPIDSKRYLELQDLFGKKDYELVFITAFPDKKILNKYIKDIAWETEVWLADHPTHMIHFNGDKFIGPYQ